MGLHYKGDFQKIAVLKQLLNLFISSHAANFVLHKSVLEIRGYSN